MLNLALVDSKVGISAASNLAGLKEMVGGHCSPNRRVWESMG